jgi:hypothetical protein
MSWSFVATGQISDITQKLEEYVGSLSGQPKIEAAEALPHLIGLVAQNFDHSRSGESMVLVSASGSGTAEGEKQITREITVTIRPVIPDPIKKGRT